MKKQIIILLSIIIANNIINDNKYNTTDLIIFYICTFLKGNNLRAEGANT